MATGQPVHLSCGGGHEFARNPRSILRGTTCPACDRRARIEREWAKLSATVEARGGSLISHIEDYSNSTTKVCVACGNGHEFAMRPANLNSGQWCRRCAGTEPKTLADMEQMAKAFGGHCIAERYRGDNGMIRWRCAVGHEFSARPTKVKQGRWCKRCSTKLRERICRALFESMFNASFETVRPDWLPGPKGYPLELDGYCEPYRVAFEYQGVQHTRPVKHFGGARRHEALRLRDELKRKMCREHGVLLIEVPRFRRSSYEHLPPLVTKAYAKAGRALPTSFDGSRLDVSPAYRTSQAMLALEELRAIAKSWGGELLSEEYRGSQEYLRWRCAEGHEWNAWPQSIKGQGSWCPRCAGTGSKVTTEMARELAAKLGLELLGEYVNSKTAIKLRCTKGHITQKKWRSLREGKSGCARCARTTIEELQAKAREHGGWCLSSNFVSSKTLYEWECRDTRHPTWRASWNSVSRGSWCLRCYHQRRRTG